MSDIETEDKDKLFCSFCGKSQHEVKKLIAGPTVFICDECVDLCTDIIKEESKTSLIKSSKKQEYTILHTTLKVLLLIGVFSLVFIDTSLLLDKVIETLK